MKTIIALLIAAAIILPSCRKSGSSTSGGGSITYSYTGALKGYNLSMTACGGKYWVAINGVPAAGDTSLLSFDTLPSGSGLDPASESLSTPVNVKLNWHASSEGCGNILIDAIARD